MSCHGNGQICSVEVPERCPETAKRVESPGRLGREKRAPGGAGPSPHHVTYRNGLSLCIYEFQIISSPVPVVAENNKGR